MSDKHRKKTDAEEANPMSAEAFRAWRRRLGLKQKEAADLLGLKKRMIQYYETGSRDGKHVSIPKSIRLACYALESGIADYDGTQVLGHLERSGLRLVSSQDEVSFVGTNGAHPPPQNGVPHQGLTPPPLPRQSVDE